MEPKILFSALVGTVLLFGGTIVGIFQTSKGGFGRYTTSLIILVLVLFSITLAFVLGKVDGQPFVNILFAVAGYAGGQVAGKKISTPREDNGSTPKP
jgi:hypothetical protein